MSFASCLKPLVENDTRCELFDMKISFYSPDDKTRFLMKVFFTWPQYTNEGLRNSETAN